VCNNLAPYCHLRNSSWRCLFDHFLPMDQLHNCCAACKILLICQAESMGAQEAESYPRLNIFLRDVIYKVLHRLIWFVIDDRCFKFFLWIYIKFRL
jgi:hypothetical protein